MNPKTNTMSRLGSFAFLFLILGANSAFAAGGGAGALPWEAPLETLKDSLTGPVAMALGLIAFFAGGAILVFGGELGDWTKRVVYIIMVMALLLMGNTVITTLFPGAASL